MRKRSIICTMLALVMILGGTGYAYWADTLNVTTRAKTGDLNVTFADLGLYAQYSNEYNAGNWSIIDGIGDSGYVGAEFFQRNEEFNKIAKDGSIDDYYNRAKGYNQVEFDAKLVDAKPLGVKVDVYDATVNSSDRIELKISQMYPGYAQTFRTDILNTGSIAARLSELQFNVDASNGITENMLGVALLIEREYQVPGENGANVFQLCKALNLPSSSMFTIGNVNFIRLSALKNLKVRDAITNANLMSLPNINRMDLYLGVGMDPDAEGAFTSGSTKLMKPNDDASSQNKSANVSINLLWDQFNEGKDVNATNRLEKQNK